MKIKGYHHIGLYAKDSEESRVFYEALGGRVCHSFLSESTGKNVYLIEMGGSAIIEVIPKGIDKAEQDPHWVHVAFKTEDSQAEYETAIKAGARSLQNPMKITLGTMTAANAFVLGPDGEIIEFFEELPL